MMGFRDVYGEGEHTVTLDGVELSFGPDGVLWSPSPRQQAVLERDGVRLARFPRVGYAPASPAPPPPEEAPAVTETPLVGEDFAEALVGQALTGEAAPPDEMEPAAEDETEAEAETETDTPHQRRRRRR